MYFDFETMNTIIPLFIGGIFLITIISSISERSKNNNSPGIKVDARVVSKRKNTTYYNHGDISNASGINNNYTTLNTHYYVTFEVDSKDKMEFKVDIREYKGLTEGDCGILYFQGSRYLKFKKEII